MKKDEEGKATWEKGKQGKVVKKAEISMKE